MNNNALKITQINVYPNKDSMSAFKASAKVVLNNCLVLNGMKVIKGQFGHFLSFPNQSPGLPYKFYETSSMRFRKSLQNSVLQEYAKKLANPGAVAV